VPIYEYRCPDCGHQLEKRQSFSAAPLTDCPACGGGNLKKLVSMTAFALKGDGWFSDHYGLRKAPAEGAKGEGSAEAPKADAPKADAPKAEAPKAEAPKATPAPVAASKPAGGGA
jgi:putative FmdB family regulatory protein